MTKSMKHSVAVAKLPKHSRYDELKGMLEQRQREILNDIKSKMREARVDGAEKPHEVLDPGDTAELDAQEDLEFVLIQMKAETLGKITEALWRLDNGTYGDCVECGNAIAGARLRALPFAVRCKECEEARETAQQRERMQQRRLGSLGFDMRG
jgi:DnaK suppressor protein